MPLNPPLFYTGVLGTGALGSVELPIIGWEVKPIVKLVEFANSKSGAGYIREATFADAAVLLDIDYDFANALFGGAYGLVPGANITNLKLFLNQTGKGNLDGSHWGFASVVISSTPQRVTHEKKLVTRVLGKSSGAIAFPT